MATEETELSTTQAQYQQLLLQLSNLSTICAETARATERTTVALAQVADALVRLTAVNETLVNLLVADDEEDDDGGEPPKDLDGNPMPGARDQTQSLDRPPRPSPQPATASGPSGVAVDGVMMRRPDPHGGLG
jgi:hypothetical protein